MTNEKPKWADKHYAYFCNQTCEYFPCHTGVSAADFNCLFCYCPLYLLGDACGGNFVMLESGVKDCSGCTIPHQRKNYGMITEKCTAFLQTLGQK